MLEWVMGSNIEWVHSNQQPQNRFNAKWLCNCKWKSKEVVLVFKADCSKSKEGPYRDVKSHSETSRERSPAGSLQWVCGEKLSTHLELSLCVISGIHSISDWFQEFVFLSITNTRGNTGQVEKYRIEPLILQGQTHLSLLNFLFLLLQKSRWDASNVLLGTQHQGPEVLHELPRIFTIQESRQVYLHHLAIRML